MLGCIDDKEYKIILDFFAFFLFGGVGGGGVQNKKSRTIGLLSIGLKRKTVRNYVTNVF